MVAGRINNYASNTARRAALQVWLARTLQRDNDLGLGFVSDKLCPKTVAAAKPKRSNSAGRLIGVILRAGDVNAIPNRSVAIGCGCVNRRRRGEEGAFEPWCCG
jgi:hypothetical protein